MDLLIPLDSRHRAAVTAHLLSLSADDRAERFMVAADDGYVRRYAAGIGSAADILLGVLRGCRLVGVAHAAVYAEGGELACEVGISVSAGSRRRGLGKQLLLGAIDAAKRLRVCRLYVLSRTSNRAMAALAGSIGGRVERKGCDASAVFEIGPARGLPLAVHGSRHGSEMLQAIHPRERVGALLVQGARGDGYRLRAKRRAGLAHQLGA